MIQVGKKKKSGKGDRENSATKILLSASHTVLVVKNLPANAGDVKRHEFDP